VNWLGSSWGVSSVKKIKTWPDPAPFMNTIPFYPFVPLRSISLAMTVSNSPLGPCPGLALDNEEELVPPTAERFIVPGTPYLTSPTKVPSDNLGRIRRMGEIEYNFLCIMALGDLKRRFIH
jgi:hypothetical protein